MSDERPPGPDDVPPESSTPREHPTSLPDEPTPSAPPVMPDWRDNIADPTGGYQPSYTPPPAFTQSEPAAPSNPYSSDPRSAYGLPADDAPAASMPSAYQPEPYQSPYAAAPVPQYGQAGSQPAYYGGYQPPMGPGVLKSGPAGVYASWGKRALARLLDGLVLIIPALVLGLPAIFLYIGSFETDGGSYDPFTNTNSYDVTGIHWPALIGSIVLWLLLAVLQLAYYIFFIGRSGQTLGKKWVNIRVKRIDGSPVGYALATGRYFSEVLFGILSSIACGLPIWLLDFLWPLWDPNMQTLHDKMAKTVVVDES